ncbi:unnamed protein product [Spodoptera littoralis]|uniref:Uncharacterized protein n=1 Tax=Spodoptera littoralis TaxID=7109 RepID=A0A9P0I981_SPOLI|nr:unnamed protein product [Spodoptera littoralis]CAH1643389.1 unnamed protein product [Spodoptera littoralis]
MDVIRKQDAAIKDIITSMKNGEPVKLMKLLEIFNTNAETDVQVKLFSILSGYLMLNDNSIETIATCSQLYDKLYKILVNCPPRKATVAFNFLSALLYEDLADNQRRNSIVVYARNLIRSSGCLAAICDLFTSCMMSLLQNHSRNIALFVECNGMTLFQREFLQHDICLQLLATIVQSSTEAAKLIVNTDIGQHLRSFLQRYGPHSQLGQWSTIILYHISRVEASLISKKMDTDNKENNKYSESFLNKVSQNRKIDCSDDTTIFFRNVMKEIMLCGTQKEINFKPFLSTNVIKNSPGNAMDISRAPFCENSKKQKSFCMGPPETIKFYAKHKPPAMSSAQLQELSLSFLRNQHSSKSRTATIMTSNIFLESTQRTLQTNANIVQQRTDSFMEDNLTRSCTQEIDDFKPQFMSTPKKDVHEASQYQTQHDNNSYRSTRRLVKNHQVKRQVKKRVTRHFNQTKTNKEIKHKSFSGRFFDAINTSCTTLVKTVKNIFTPKNTLQETKDNPINRTNRDMSCSYSFTNYMRKRDAVIKDNYKEDTKKGLVNTKDNFQDVSMEINNSCKTCNDTVTLKRKLRNDEHLKKTLRKLKLGINLYGCDFKKISRAMWPKETYMTPIVLYNLYRKLILK